MKFLVIFLLILAAFGFFYFADKKAHETTKIQVNGIEVGVKIADTAKKRSQGLMHVENLGENQGMFFIFPTSNFHTFWMKNTLISLDLIWINKNNEIVHIKENAQPCKTLNCEVYSTPKPAKYVLEVNGGWVEKNGVGVGNLVVR
ncbi:DUF192 domain-containing protein [Patescibacteria group bacterium]